MCGQWKQIKLVLVLCSLSALTVHAQNTSKQTEPQVGQKLTGNIITLVDGYSFEVDEVWKQGDDTWYRIGNVRKQLSQPVKSVKPIFEKVKRSEEHTSELQSHSFISYAVFCLKKK